MVYRQRAQLELCVLVQPLRKQGAFAGIVNNTFFCSKYECLSVCKKTSNCSFFLLAYLQAENSHLCRLPTQCSLAASLRLQVVNSSRYSPSQYTLLPDPSFSIHVPVLCSSITATSHGSKTQVLWVAAIYILFSQIMKLFFHLYNNHNSYSQYYITASHYRSRNGDRNTDLL